METSSLDTHDAAGLSESEYSATKGRAPVQQKPFGLGQLGRAGCKTGPSSFFWVRIGVRIKTGQKKAELAERSGHNCRHDEACDCSRYRRHRLGCKYESNNSSC